MTYSNEMPLAALSIGQFKEFLQEWAMPAVPSSQDEAPEAFGKAECSKMTGFAINTINRFICDRTIPYYKMNSRVLFKRDEIKDWMLSKRVGTNAEFVAVKEVQLSKKAAK